MIGTGTHLSVSTATKFIQIIREDHIICISPSLLLESLQIQIKNLLYSKSKFISVTTSLLRMKTFQ